MAQSTQTLHFICRSCRSQLSKPLTQTRQFSKTTSRSRSIPSFTPTTSPELDALLLDWRNRVFTPSALSQHHQALIYKQKHRTLLDNDPGVLVTMSNDEEVKLTPMNRFDRPNKAKSLNELYSILSSNTDVKTWEILPAFLEGLEMSRQKPGVVWLEKITRKANEVGRAGVIKHCAEMVKKTGVKLSYAPVTRQFLLGYHDRLAAVDFKSEQIVDLAQEAERFVLLLEKPEHCSGQLREGETDMRRSLIVVGTLLELSAAKANETQGGRDTDGSVASYMKKLIALGKGDVLQRDQKPDSRRALEDYVPIANGIKMALAVKETSIKKTERLDLEVMLEKLRKGIEQEKVLIEQEVSGKAGRPFMMLNKVGRL